MRGFHGKFLRVNLTDRTWQEDQLPAGSLRWLGGRGLATHLLMENMLPGANPLGPGNVLILATGPATDTRIPAAGRHGVFTKSPQTGLYCESYSGGHVAPMIKRTGYDAILLEGTGEEPVWLHITPDGASFHPAGHLWGKDAYTAEDLIRTEAGGRNAQAMVIGPAGENGVVFAGISNNYWRCAGRGGTGAVLGAKKVKGLAFSGNKKAEIADQALLERFLADLKNRAQDNPGVRAYRELGTPMMVDILNNAGAFPTGYWQEGRFVRYGQINATAMQRRFKVRPRSCHRCFIGCGKLSAILDGRHRGLTLEGPEYETIYAFGGLCRLDDIAEILYLNDLCDRLGMDTISAGNLAALAIEAGLRGKLPGAPAYGDADGIAALLHKIAYRHDEGELLARGIKEAARELGLWELAVHVKGLEPAGYDPRVLKGMGLAYATAPRGACHLRATFYKPELTGMIDPDAIAGKAELFIDFEDRATLFDTLIFCRFYRDLIGWDELAMAIRALTGLALDKAGLGELAGQITTEIRRFNLREGMNYRDDTLPIRFFSEPTGEHNEHIITREELDVLVADYYRLRGWDEAGRPLE